MKKNKKDISIGRSLDEVQRYLRILLLEITHISSLSIQEEEVKEISKEHYDPKLEEEFQWLRDFREKKQKDLEEIFGDYNKVGNGIMKFIEVMNENEKRLFEIVKTINECVKKETGQEYIKSERVNINRMAKEEEAMTNARTPEEYLENVRKLKEVNKHDHPINKIKGR